MLGPSDLVLCSGTLLHASLREMVEAASANGYAGITLWPNDVRGAHAAGLDDADIRSLIADHGLVVAELDPLLSWVPGLDLSNLSEQEQGFLGVTEHDFYAIAEAVGGTAINIAQGFGASIDRDAAIEAFAGLCDRAKEHGLDVVLEFLPWSGIPDARTALEIVEKAGRDNGGITLDTWHHFRGPYVKRNALIIVQ